MHPRPSLLALAIATTLPPMAQAAEDEATLTDMVVTATKTAKVASEAPATVTVIGRKEIEDKNTQRVDEALAGAPGVFIRGQGGEQPSNWQNQVTLRGIPGYYRTGVLLDGVPINNAFSSGVNMSLVPVEDIQQIEVVPGPFSSLYGGAGMAGVINIITRRPEKRELSVAADAGSHDFKSLTAGYRNRLSDTLAISFNAGHKVSDGYADEYVTKTTSGSGGTVVSGWEKTTTATGATTYIVGDKGKTAWQQDNYGAKLYLTPRPDSTLILEASQLSHRTKDSQGSSYLSDGSAPFTSGTASIDGGKATIRASDFLTATNGEDVSRVAATYDSKLTADIKLKASLSYQDNQYWYTSITSSASDSSGPGKLSDIPARAFNGDLQLGFPLGDSHYLLVGASANRASLRKKVYELANWRQERAIGGLGDWADGNSDFVAAYVQDEMALSSALTVYAGARYDRWSTDGTIFINGNLNTYESRSRSAFNPKLAAVYRLDEATVIKGAVGRAFRAPNLSDMYSTFGTSTIYWSNPDLKPEKATTAEISAERTFATGTLLRATYYRSDITDLIYTTTSGNDRYKLNAGSAEVEGTDLEIRQKLGAGLTAFANATFVDTTITENSVRPNSVGKQIPLQARRLANLGIEGSYGPWSGSVIATYTGKMYSNDDNSDTINHVPGSYDPNVVVGAKLNYRVDRHLTASLAVTNLLDRDYYLGSSKADGRAVYLGLRFKY